MTLAVCEAVKSQRPDSQSGRLGGNRRVVGNAPEWSVAHGHADAKRQMSKKYALELLVVVVLLGAIAIAPSVLPVETLQSPYWKIGLVVVWLVAVGAFWIRGIVLTREDTKTEIGRTARALESDKRFEEIYTLLSKPLPAVDAPANKATEAGSRQILREKVIQLGRDLFTFLRKQGPEPQVEKPQQGEATEEYLRRAVRLTGPRVRAIHHGYEADFRDRVVKIYHELEAAGIRHGLQASDIDPQAQSEDRIRKIAETLLVVAARMDAENASGELTSPVS